MFMVINQRFRLGHVIIFQFAIFVSIKVEISWDDGDWWLVTTTTWTTSARTKGLKGPLVVWMIPTMRMKIDEHVAFAIVVDLGF